MQLNGYNLVALRGLSESPAFPIIGRNGSKLVQPGSSLGLRGRGTVVRISNMQFRLKKISSAPYYNCNQNFSVVYVNHRLNRVDKQDASVCTFGRDSFLVDTYPNEYGDEFFLFPRPSLEGTTGGIVGNGGRAVDSFVWSPNAEYDDDTSQKLFYLRAYPNRSWSVTVIVRSNDLSVNNALDVNLLGVFIPFFPTGRAEGQARWYTVTNFKKLRGSGLSSVKYGGAHVYSRLHDRITSGPEAEETNVTIGLPVLRMYDGSSMIGPSSYSDGALIDVEVIFTAANSTAD